jgi:hypothetical protein
MRQMMSEASQVQRVWMTPAPARPDDNQVRILLIGSIQQNAAWIAFEKPSSVLCVGGPRRARSPRQLVPNGRGARQSERPPWFSFHLSVDGHRDEGPVSV